MTWVFYRGAVRRIIIGPQTGTEYACEPRGFLQVEDADVGQLLRMPKGKCGCGHMFQRRSPRGSR